MKTYECPSCGEEVSKVALHHCSLEQGRKDDAGKDPWGLLPFDAVREIVRVLAFGRGKYGARNWEAGMDWSRPFDAMMRHLTAWWQGESKDWETNTSHLANAGCCLLFLLAYEIRGIGKDDRPTRLPHADHKSATEFESYAKASSE